MDHRVSAIRPAHGAGAVVLCQPAADAGDGRYQCVVAVLCSRRSLRDHHFWCGSQCPCCWSPCAVVFRLHTADRHWRDLPTSLVQIGNGRFPGLGDHLGQHPVPSGSTGSGASAVRGAGDRRHVRGRGNRSCRACANSDRLPDTRHRAVGTPSADATVTDAAHCRRHDVPFHPLVVPDHAQFRRWFIAIAETRFVLPNGPMP